MRWKLRQVVRQLKDGSYESVVYPHTADSDAGYSVMRCTTNGVPIDLYMAFVGKSGDPGFKYLGRGKTKEEAVALCEAHLSLVQQVEATA